MTAPAETPLLPLPAEPAAVKPQGLSTPAILEALERHYRKPGTDRGGEILIPEVQAPGSTRRADLVRIGMWASRGTGIDVHEIKVSRSDWLRELGDPAKAEAWWPYCNRFWVVAVPGIVAEGELPPEWGLMELPAPGRRFRVRVAAGSRKDIRLTIPLMVELLRRADNQRLGEMDALRRRHQEELYRQENAWRARKSTGELAPELKDRLELLERLEEAMGMPLKPDRYGDWKGQPPSRITPGELADLLSDAAEHVSVQRRAADLEVERNRLHRAATFVLERLKEEPDGTGPGRD